jgi:hypothetical protein
MIKKLGGEVTTNTDLGVVLVAEKVKRAPKFLCCISLGKPIVGKEWLELSVKAGAFVGN